MSTTKSPNAGARIADTPKRKRKSGNVGGRGPLILVGVILCVILGALMLNRLTREEPRQIDNPRIAQLAQLKLPSWVEEQILPKGADSRRGELLEDLNEIVIHYVGNPGSTAGQNRNYYANPGTEVNSHFLIGLEGEILQCLPLEEKSSASSQRNRDTISIEVCHPDELGQFSQESYDALVRLTAWLCIACDLDEANVIRHYDITGKECPLYYVTNEEAWEQLKADIKAEMKALQADAQ